MDSGMDRVFPEMLMDSTNDKPGNFDDLDYYRANGASSEARSSQQEKLISFRSSEYDGVSIDEVVDDNIRNDRDLLKLMDWCEDDYYGKRETIKKANAHHHVLVERRRRQKLSHLFISLASLIPALSKEREKKTSIIGEAINYIKELEQQLHSLEHKIPTRTATTQDRTKDSAEICQVLREHRSFSPEKALDIEVQFSDHENDNNYIMIGVHCKRNENVKAKLHSEMRKLHLLPSNTTVMPFGDYIDITVIAQKEESEFSMTREEVQSHLQQALQQCYN